MLITEPLLGRQTARAEFGLDVFDARAPLLVDDLAAALPAVGVVVGVVEATCEVRQDISDEDHGVWENPMECDWG